MKKFLQSILFAQAIYIVPINLYSEENPKENSVTEENAIKQDQRSSPLPVKPDLDEEEKAKRDERTLPFALGVSYTYWKPYLTGVNVLVSRGTDDTRGKVISPNTFPVSGIQVHGEVFTFHNNWRLKANYTWFYFSPHFSNKAFSKNSSLIYESPFFDEQGAFYTNFASKYKTLFNKLDAYFVREYSIGDSLTLAPKAGLLGAWEMMRLYFDGEMEEEFGENIGAKMSQFWWGIGPYSGTTLNFQLVDGLSLYGVSNLAILYTKHDVQQANFVTNQETEEREAVSNLSDYYYGVEPMLEAKLGLNYLYAWDNVSLAIDLGWEMQTYFSHIGLLKFYSPTGQAGQFSTQGLTAGILVGF
ncbi:hypothetical protein K0U07_02215 [bacterium]|nr:hypothetical protein [bacterium]